MLELKNISFCAEDENGIKEIIKDNSSLFPLVGIRYLEMGNVNVLIRNLDSKFGTIIKKI